MRATVAEFRPGGQCAQMERGRVREANSSDVRSNLRIDRIAGTKLAQAGGVFAYCLHRRVQMVRGPEENGEAAHVAQKPDIVRSFYHTMSTETVTNQNQGVVHSQAGVPLEIQVETATRTLARLQEDFIASLPFATESQALAVIAAAESEETVKVPGFNTTFRLSKANKADVQLARARHGKAMTAKREEIAEEVARSEITSRKYKLAKDGKSLLCKLAYVAPRAL